MLAAQLPSSPPTQRLSSPARSSPSTAATPSRSRILHTRGRSAELLAHDGLIDRCVALKSTRLLRGNFQIGQVAFGTRTHPKRDGAFRIAEFQIVHNEARLCSRPNIQASLGSFNHDSIMRPDSRF